LGKVAIRKGIVELGEQEERGKKCDKDYRKAIGHGRDGLGEKISFLSRQKEFYFG
jgi:hypothetical protein